jgi:glycosyltransferase involved in cell wall biosynthesis
MPAVSVLISTYNRTALLPRALESLAEQTFDDFEVVVVNDGGADPSPVLERYGDRLDIRLTTHPTNLGVTQAQNTAIEAAAGEFITLLADDDRYLPDHLQVLYEAVVAAPGTIPYTDGMQVVEDAAGHVQSRKVLPVPQVFDRDRLLIENYIPAIALMIPVGAFAAAGGAFDTGLEVLEDWELWLRLSDLYEFRRIGLVTFEYYVRGGRSNITSREVWRFHQCLQRVYDRHPVESGSRPASLRERVLTASRRRADAYLFDLSIVIDGGADPAALLAAMQRIVTALAGRSYELIAITPRTDEMEALAAQITGDVSFVFSEGDVDLEALAARRAAGRRIHLIDDPSDLRIDELPVGATAEVKENTCL